MKTRILILLVAASAWAQPTALQVEGATSTQVVVSYTAPSASACTLELSESPSFAPLVHDVNPALFAGANSDARAVTGAGVAGRRVVVLGTQDTQQSGGSWYSRGLRADTAHYLRVTCGSAATTSFRTATISGLPPRSPLFNPNAHGNFPVPTMDYTSRSVGVVDPQTGAFVRPISLPGDRGGRLTDTAQAVLGASGWTNASNLLNASTTTASTTNTNSAFAWVDTTRTRVFAGWNAFTWNGMAGLGVDVWGSGSDANAANRAVNLCLSVDSGQSCYTDAVPVTLPTGSNALVGTFPGAWQTPLFGGWSRPVPRELWTSAGIVLVAGTTVTRVAGDSNGGQVASWFRREWVPGTRIFIQNSAPTCPNNLCTIVSVSSRNAITIAESLTNPTTTDTFNSGSAQPPNGSRRRWFTSQNMFQTPTITVNGAPQTVGPAGSSGFQWYWTPNGNQIDQDGSGTVLTSSDTLVISYLTPLTYKSANFGIMVAKTTATGTANISIGLRVAAYMPYHQQPDSQCSTSTVSTTVDSSGAPLGRTMTGYLCLFSTLFDIQPSLWFVGSSEYDVRLLSLLQFPPAVQGFASKPNVVRMSGADPNTMYTSVLVSGKQELWRLTYSGNYSTPANILWSYNPLIGSVSGYTDPVSWTGVATGANSINDRINAVSGWDAAQRGTLAPIFQGVVDGYAIYYDLVEGQDTGGTVWSFDASTGALVATWDTLQNSSPGNGWNAIHNVNPTAHRVWIATGGQPYLYNGPNANIPYYGPFISSVQGVYKGGVLSTNLAIPWPPDSSYDSACAADLPQQWKDRGAVGNQCIRIRLANQPCSSFSTLAERTATPCPGDPTRSWIGRNVAPGDAFQVWPSVDQLDAEAFLVVRVTPISGTVFEVEALRDYVNGYRCQQSANSLSRRCVAIPSQATYGNTGWSVRFLPQCYMTVWDPSNGSFTCRNEWLQRGHYDTTGRPMDQFSAVGIDGSSTYYAQVNQSDPSSMSGAVGIAYIPQFPASLTNPNYVQSYVSTEGSDATGTAAQYGTDWRHYNPALGASIESPGQTIGGNLTITLQAGTSSVFQVSPINGLASIKTNAWHVWVGQYLLSDKSSAATGNTLTDADPWRFCYAYAAGECRAGSSAGNFYMVVPGGMETLSNCNASQISYRTPCVFASNGVSGQLVQLYVAGADPLAVRQRSLGFSFTRYGAQYVFSKLRQSPDGRTLLSTAHHYDGGATMAITIDPGSIPNDTRSGNAFVPVTVRASGNVYVEFGYNSSFHCTSRAEVCRANAATIGATPFLYASEAGSTTASSSTVAIPAIPGRVLYYRVVVGGVPGPLQVVAVP